jgi:hypothetical protein
MAIVRDFEAGNLNAARLNYAIMTLIPKEPDAREMKKFCPISTGGKRGFHSTHMSRTKFDPRPMGSSVPVHLKMWAREHWSRFKRYLQSRFHLTAGTNGPWTFRPGSCNKPGLKMPFSPGWYHEPGQIIRSNEPPIRASYRSTTACINDRRRFVLLIGNRRRRVGNRSAFTSPARACALSSSPLFHYINHSHI